MNGVFDVAKWTEKKSKIELVDFTVDYLQKSLKEDVEEKETKKAVAALKALKEKLPSEILSVDASVVAIQFELTNLVQAYQEEKASVVVAEETTVAKTEKVKTKKSKKEKAAPEEEKAAPEEEEAEEEAMDYKTMDEKSLKKIAKSFGLKVKKSMTKKDLIKLLKFA